VQLHPTVLVLVLALLAGLGWAVALPAMICSGLLAAACSTGTVVAAEAVRARTRR
jgi:hypothetical protein